MGRGDQGPGHRSWLDSADLHSLNKYLKTSQSFLIISNISAFVSVDSSGVAGHLIDVDREVTRQRERGIQAVSPALQMPSWSQSVRDLELINCVLPESQTPLFPRGRGFSGSHTEGDSGFSRDYSELMIRISTYRRNTRLHEEDKRIQMHFPSYWPGSIAYSSTFCCFVFRQDLAM